jgi:hypothetical protein
METWQSVGTPSIGLDALLEQYCPCQILFCGPSRLPFVGPAVRIPDVNEGLQVATSFCSPSGHKVLNTPADELSSMPHCFDLVNIPYLRGWVSIHNDYVC